jgi:hydrogenase maturation protease
LNDRSSPCPVLVLGMGNLLLEDEGLGIRALELLQLRYEHSADVAFLDGGTTGMGLLDDMSRRQHVLVLDACQTGDPPGTLVRLAGDDVPVYFGMRISPHQLGLSEVLATLELSGEKPADVVVLGLVPESVEMRLELSGLITRELDGLVEAAAQELARLGYAPVLKTP